MFFTSWLSFLQNTDVLHHLGVCQESWIKAVCLCDTEELTSVLHNFCSITWDLAQVSEQHCRASLWSAPKLLHCLPKFGVFFHDSWSLLLWCSSGPKGFLVCVFWMGVLFLLPQVGLFLVECLHQMNSRHEPACPVLLKLKACLSSSGAHL